LTTDEITSSEQTVASSDSPATSIVDNQASSAQSSRFAAASVTKQTPENSEPTVDLKDAFASSKKQDGSNWLFILAAGSFTGVGAGAFFLNLRLSEEEEL
jgi:hypothetical protein